MSLAGASGLVLLMEVSKLSGRRSGDGAKARTKKKLFKKNIRLADLRRRMCSSCSRSPHRGPARPLRRKTNAMQDQRWVPFRGLRQPRHDESMRPFPAFPSLFWISRPGTRAQTGD